MPSFAYKGQDDSGIQEGFVESASAGSAAMALRARGIIPFEIKENQAVDKTNGKKSGSMSIDSIFGNSKPAPKREEVMMLARQLNVLMKAGVPILTGLACLRDAASGKAMKSIVSSVITQLESGKDFSNSLASHPEAFDEFFVSMVRVGEETGSLDDVFWALYERMEFDERIRKQIKTATRYPMFVMIAVGIALALVNLLVIPAFSKVFTGLGAELPFLTRVLIGTSKFSQEQLPLLIVMLTGAWLTFKQWIQTDAGKLAWHGFILKLPFFGIIIFKASIARFCRGMALALSSGVPVISAISIVARTTDNESLGVRLSGMRETIERGESVLNAATRSGIFSSQPMILAMIAVGDQSGQLDDMMNEIASSCTKDVQYELQTLSQRIEPVLIAVMGVMVLILALGIFLPIWDLGRITLHKSQ